MERDGGAVQRADVHRRRGRQPRADDPGDDDGAEAATTTTTAYTLTINPVAEGPTLTGTIGTANEGGTVTLGLTDALPDGDGTLGNVTITGLAGDLSNFNGGTYTAGTGTWRRDGGAVQRADVHRRRRGRQPRADDPGDDDGGGSRDHHHDGLHADHQPGCGRSDADWHDRHGQRRRHGDAGADRRAA